VVLVVPRDDNVVVVARDEDEDDASSPPAPLINKDALEAVFFCGRPKFSNSEGRRPIVNWLLLFLRGTDFSSSRENDVSGT